MSVSWSILLDLLAWSGHVEMLNLHQIISLRMCTECQIPNTWKLAVSRVRQIEDGSKPRQVSSSRKSQAISYFNINRTVITQNVLFSCPLLRKHDLGALSIVVDRAIEDEKVRIALHHSAYFWFKRVKTCKKKH